MIISTFAPSSRFHVPRSRRWWRVTNVESAGRVFDPGAVYYFVSFKKRDEKSMALSVILTVVFGPLIGYAYARPAAWMMGLVAEVCFFAPIGIGAGLLIQQGSMGLGGILVAYLVVAAIIPAVFMTQDQNEQVAGREPAA